MIPWARTAGGTGLPRQGNQEFDSGHGEFDILFESQMEMLNRLWGDGQAGHPSLRIFSEMMLKAVRLGDT